MSDFFYDKQIILQKEVDGIMYHGVKQQGTYAPVKTISCDVQPATRDLVFKEYGYYIDCTKRVFCDIDTDIIDGSIVTYKNVKFKIMKLVDWDEYYDIFMKEV